MQQIPHMRNTAICQLDTKVGSPPYAVTKDFE